MGIFQKTLFALLLMTLIVPISTFAEDDPFLTCRLGGSCGIPGGGAGGGVPSTGNIPGGGSFPGIAGPVKTGPGGGEPVNVTNPWVGIASPVLNAISGATAAETGQTFFEWAQEFVLEALKKRILDMMVAEIIQWVQGGDEPRFVTDWQGFLEEAGDIATSEFLDELNLSALCQPFSSQIKDLFSLPASGGGGGGSGGFSSRISCTLDDVVGNIEEFYNDFSAGGWVAYQKAWEPENNFFGAYLIAKQEKERRVAKAQQAARDEALAGGGFLSPKSCTEAVGGTGPDIDKDGIPGDIASKCDVVTPGSVVEELTKRAVTADIDYLINAEQLSTYLAAIADAVFNRLIREGTAGLSGLSTDDAPDGGSIAAEDSGCEAFPNGSPLFSACEDYVNSNNDNFIATRNGIIEDINQAIAQYALAIAATENSASSSIELVEFLKDASARCTSRAEIEKIEAKITELQESIPLIQETIDLLNEAIDTINNIALNEWGEYTRAVSAIQDEMNFATATAVAQLATGQNDAILAEIELIEDRVNDCED